MTNSAPGARMATPPAFTIDQILVATGGRPLHPSALSGRSIHGVGTLCDARPDFITWIADKRLTKKLAATQAGAILGTDALLNGHARGIAVADPDLAIARVLMLFDIQPSVPEPGIHPSAVVHKSARLADGVRVGAYAVINANVAVGEGTIIHEGVSIGADVQIGRQCVLFDRSVLYDRTILGNNVIIHAGAVLGADGFGYIFRDGQHLKLPHIGNVIVEADVEIGPNSVVDRGKFGPTRIGHGSKIDALVMVAHNVQMGPLCVLAGQAGVSGSVRLGTGVIAGGQTGFIHGLTIGDGVKVGAKSGVMADFPAGQTLLGTPAQDSNAQLRDTIRVRKLQKLYGEVAELTRRVKELEAAADHRKHD